MKERPIIFSGEMVRAILDGRKTQTRRVIKPPPILPYAIKNSFDAPTGKVRFEIDTLTSPYGQPEDRLWVRESLRGDGLPGNRRKSIMRYAADGEMVLVDGVDVVWQFKKPVVPSIHMPRWAARLLLEIVSVRMERLKAISEGDAKKEGVVGVETAMGMMYKPAFSRSWDAINDKRGFGWNTNPWVWVIEFKRMS